MPCGRTERRRPVTGNDAADRSMPITPLRWQKRRNERNATTKNCAEPADTLLASRSTALVTTAVSTSRRSAPWPYPLTNLRARST